MPIHECRDKGTHKICHVDRPEECPPQTYFHRKAPPWQEKGKYQCFVRK